MEIRFARLSDLDQVFELETANFSKEERISEQVLETFLKEVSQTCLVMEEAGQLAGFVLASPWASATVTDEIFYLESGQLPIGQHLAIASLSVAPNYQGQGVGTLLLAGLKEVAVQGNYQGIALTCKESLIKYYQINQFEDQGPSQSQFGGKTWYDMYWKA
ncbi:GNAT family N-acetyltransferase [Streptococcus suis]|uniref:GNAT family N-acetyltransferase n=1 Tax=Streptococcus suis TaxID=1307 RepID=UPI000CF51616|nr:GNAT family N-acetyltransferase [Streptococcus suis]